MAFIQVREERVLGFSGYEEQRQVQVILSGSLLESCIG